MAFPWTLQRYVFREMRNTYLLTALALTGVLGLGGGVLNMIKLGEVTPGQFLRLMLLVLPVAIALTLPMAALFAASSVYGRMSADNELTACRSGGINLHVLLLPTLVLSLVSASITFLCVNMVIPRMIRNLNLFLSSDVTTLIRERVQRPRGMTLGGHYRIHADKVFVPPDDPTRVVLDRVAFVEVEGSDWVRFGTAAILDLRVLNEIDTIRVSGTMRGLSLCDRKEGRFVDLDEKTVPPMVVPAMLPPLIKFLTLGELWHFRSHPTEWNEVRESAQQLKAGLMSRTVYAWMLEEGRAHQGFTLSSDDAHFQLRAQRWAEVPQGGGIELADVWVDEVQTQRRRTWNAERATIEVLGKNPADLSVRLELHDAVSESRATTPARVSLNLALPPLEQFSTIEGWTTESLLQAAADAPPGAPVVKQSEQLVKIRDTIVRRIVGTIHERTAFSVSVFVLVLLGAVLGIIFRGSHVLTAFGISFIPLVVVMVAIVTGRQMAHNANTHELGLGVMWSGIAAVALLDFWTLTRVLRR